jgi:hypothetical protein
VNQQESTIANADLWAKYFHEQWAWLKPLAGPDAVTVAAGAGARIANFLTLVAAGPIAWMYTNSASSNITPLRPSLARVDAGADLESVEEHAA